MVAPVACRNAEFFRSLLSRIPHRRHHGHGRTVPEALGWGPLGKGAQAASEDVEPAELECLDGIIDKTLGADIPGVSRGLAEQREAT